MNPRLILGLLSLLLSTQVRAADGLEEFRRELAALKQRVETLEAQNAAMRKQLEVDRLVVRRELIVSDTARPWEAGFETQQIPRGIVARSLGDGVAGLWVRSRLIKGEIDDPFDDRFHALEHDGQIRRAPGHISWNAWIDGAWRQMALIQGEGLEFSEVPVTNWSGGNHPGRLRFQTYRPGHGEPLTDALIGQGKMSLGGGGFGGGGLPFPRDVLHIWGGAVIQADLPIPAAPVSLEDDQTGPHHYAIIALGPQGRRSRPSPILHTRGRARLRWDSVPGADTYIVIRDGKEITRPIRMEGSNKEWSDSSPN